mgnify:CR=1 FL=1|jgi:flavin prenyltransferase
MMKIGIAITGASGAVYARELLNTLMEINFPAENVSLVFSGNAKFVWETELGDSGYSQYPFPVFDRNDFTAPMASGSGGCQALIVCPCSMGTLGRIAGGISNDLITRAADVMLKERNRLILITRETPLNLIHIKNMETITLAGGIILPASPSFYSKPADFSQLARTITNRALNLVGIKTNGFSWGASQNPA